MSDFNLSEWVLKHRSITGFLMVLVMIGGIFAYIQLGQREDPPYTFRVMVVKTIYPGATALEVEHQVTDRLEKKIQELPNLDTLRSYSKPGESVIFVTPREDTPPKEIPYLWYQVRKKVGDIHYDAATGHRRTLFQRRVRRYLQFTLCLFRRRFQLRRIENAVDSARQQILRVKDVEKVDLIGVQDEKIYVEFSDKKLAELGLDPAAVAQVLQAQNGMVPAGTVFSSQRNLPIRLTGPFDSVHSVANLAGACQKVEPSASAISPRSPEGIPIRRNSGCASTARMSLVLGSLMNKKGDVLAVGKSLETTVAHIEGNSLSASMLRRWPISPGGENPNAGIYDVPFFEALAAVLARWIPQPWIPHWLGRRAHRAPGSGWHVALYAGVGYRSASDVTWCADPCAGTSGGRCHDCHRNDGA